MPRNRSPVAVNAPAIIINGGAICQGIFVSFGLVRDVLETRLLSTITETSVNETVPFLNY